MYIMSSPKVLDLPILNYDLRSVSIRNLGNKQNNIKKRSKHDRSCRKRSKSFSGCGPINPKPVLPTKFLLGGNINDPLNLNSLQDEDTNRVMNAVTPKSSPLPTPPRRKMPIEVIVSPNNQDPLHLMDCKNDRDYEEHLCSPLKKGKKKRIKKRRTMSASAEGCIPDPTGKTEARTPETAVDSAKIPEDPDIFEPLHNSALAKSEHTNKSCCILPLDLEWDKKEKTKKKSEDGNQNNFPKKFKYSMDKIVSPVVPQPGAWLKRSNSIKLPRPKQNKFTDATLPAFKRENGRFQYGNYNRYYGYRNFSNESDYRLKVFSQHPYLFENKDILDIGCNIGHITLSVARDFRARTVTGIDIDPKLISIARKNVKHYVKTANTSPSTIEITPDSSKMTQATYKSSSEFFPISLPILYGSIDIPGFHDSRQGRGFPKNVTFKQSNYVVEDESLLSLEHPQFDVILCLSTTKWIHLNWGDNGLKFTFRRIYEQLRPGGKLILEPQHWAGYKSKKKLTETIYRNYNAIELFPDKFRDYLLSPAVGFAKSEILGFPQHTISGFRRPIQVFTKSTMFPSERTEATPSNLVDNYSNFQKGLQTDKQESQNRTENCLDHVYANVFEPRASLCMSSEGNLDVSEDLSQPRRAYTRSEPLTGTHDQESAVSKALNNPSLLTNHDQGHTDDSTCQCFHVDAENSPDNDTRRILTSPISRESKTAVINISTLTNNGKQHMDGTTTVCFHADAENNA